MKSETRKANSVKEDKTMTLKEFNCYDFNYKRHLTLEQAKAFKVKWDHDGEDEKRSSEIQYKKKTDDYTVRYSRRYNG